MNVRKYQLMALLVATGLVIGGCGGGNDNKKSETADTPPATTPAATGSSDATTGQRLIDLNNARKQGAITDEEYEAAKQRLLNSQ